jgi:regulator of PEP synthase PpsR (kinase-PPPase family)
LDTTRFHLHLVSDSTGDTVHGLARACVAQFEDCEAIEHVWSMTRTRVQMERILAEIDTHRGVVLFSLVNEDLRTFLQEGCRRLNVPAIPVLDPVIGALAAFLGRSPRGLPGQQHALDHEYFARIDAMTYALTHDDGQALWGLNDADVVLLGVSRTSKTPTCIYLANRGIKAANIPLIPGMTLPPEVLSAKKPLIVGLTNDPDRLVAIRRNRLNQIQAETTKPMDYTDLNAVKAELVWARRLFIEHHWPIIDTARRSIEETAAAISQLLTKRQDRLARESA